MSSSGEDFLSLSDLGATVRSQFEGGTAIRIAIASVVGLVVAFGAAGQATAEVAWWNGHKYESVLAQSQYEWLNWYAANAAAIAAGGYLVTITSAEENQVVFNLVDSPEFWTVGGNPFGPWIGAYQPPGSPEPDGNWRWTVTDEPFSYTNWDPGEPSDADGTENAGSFVARSYGARSNKWNDLPGYFVLPGYVVEYVPEPSTLILLSMGAVGLLVYGLRRRR